MDMAIDLKLSSEEYTAWETKASILENLGLFPDHMPRITLTQCSYWSVCFSFYLGLVIVNLQLESIL